MGICRTRWVDDAISLGREAVGRADKHGMASKSEAVLCAQWVESGHLGQRRRCPIMARTTHFRSTADANLSGVDTRNDNTLTRCPPPAAWSWTDAHRGSVPLGG